MKRVIILLWLGWSLSIGVQESRALEEPLFVSDLRGAASAVSATTGLIVPLAQDSVLQAQRVSQFFRQGTGTGMHLDLANRRPEYLLTSRYGLESRQRIAEQIGDAGAREYARLMGFDPLYQGQPGQGRGFDQVYRNGRQIVVVEAKGGSSQPKVYHGFRQGTLEYTREVALDRLQSPTASIREKQAALEVIQAYRERRLVIQIVPTEHVYGDPKPTQVRTTYGKLAIPSGWTVAHRLGTSAGFAGGVLAGAFETASQLSAGVPIDPQRLAVTIGVGGVSAYAGTLTGLGANYVLSNYATRLHRVLAFSPRFAPLGSGVAGGLVAGTLFSYGEYLLGYADLKTANRSMAAGVVGSAIGTLTGWGILATATAIGTASTGTPIAALSGAVATKAALAWLGGGAVSAGGFGVAGGAMVLSGGTVLVATAATVALMYVYHLGDEKAESKRIDYLISQVYDLCSASGCSL